LLIKVVGYTRLSQESDISISSQKEDIIRYCKKHGYKLVRIFDEGEKSSGWDTAREQFNKMIEYILNPENDIKGIVVRDPSRLGRVFKDRLYWVLHLEKHGIYVHSVIKDGVIDPNDPQDLLIESVRAFSDDVIKRAEIERSKREIQKRKEKMLPLGRPPFGFKYSKDKTKLIPNGKEFEKALEVIRLRDAGFSWSEIVKRTGVSLGTAYRIYRRKSIYIRGVHE